MLFIILLYVNSTFFFLPTAPTLAIMDIKPLSLGCSQWQELTVLVTYPAEVTLYWYMRVDRYAWVLNMFYYSYCTCLSQVNVEEFHCVSIYILLISHSFFLAFFYLCYTYSCRVYFNFPFFLCSSALFHLILEYGH